MIKIALDRLRNQTDAEFEFSGNKEDLGLQDLQFPVQDLRIYLHLMEADHGFYAVGDISGIAVLNCHRCLTEFEYPLDIPVSTMVILDQTEEFKDEDELIQVKPGDRYVNLTKLIKDAILLDLPVKIVCTEDCQGLCAQCGTNLNKDQCECTDDSIDPRWEKLKEINFED